MKKAFEKLKKHVKDHQDEIIVSTVGAIWGVCAYAIGLKLGKIIGFQDGVLTCNKTWMDFAEKLQEKEE